MAKWCTPVAETCSTDYLPGNWNVSNKFLNVYTLGDDPNTVHTGDDINLPNKNDVDEPVVSIGDGTVIYAKFKSDSPWLGLVVIKHPFGDSFVCSRYGHLTDLQVSENDEVKAGQLLGKIADTDLFPAAPFPPHLHFDISRKGDEKLIEKPTHWPGDGTIAQREAEILMHYQSPTDFMEKVLKESTESDDQPAESAAAAAPPPATESSAPPVTESAPPPAPPSAPISGEIEARIVSASPFLNVRRTPDTSSDDNIVRELPDGARIEVIKGRFEVADGMTWLVLADGSGFVAAMLTHFVLDEPELTPDTEIRVVEVETSLNVRRTPDLSSEANIVGALPSGARVAVIKGRSQRVGNFTLAPLANGSGWIATELTRLETDSATSDPTSPSTPRTPDDTREPTPVMPGPTRITGKGIRGVNIDLNVADFSPPDLSAFDYCRFVFDLSQERGNTEFSDPKVAAFDAKIRGYIQQGVTPIMVLNHEFFGEGAGFVWDQMQNSEPATLQRWSELTEQFVVPLRKLVAMYGSDVVYEIWNESDAPSGAAVGVPPKAFARLLDRSLETIHAIAPGATVIVGGLVSGQPSYWEATANAMQRIGQLSGIGLHPYGRGPSGKPAQFEDNGAMRPLINAYANLSLVKSFWLTEWGVLGDASKSEPPPVSELDMAAYIRRFLADNEQDSRIVASVYFAYRDNMHNGYGLVRSDNTRKELVWKAIAKQPIVT